MFKRFMRFVPIIALFLFALLMINQPRTADASPKGDITFNYAPEHMSLSRARDGQFLSGPAAGDAYKIAVDYLNAQKAALALNGADLTFVVTDRYTSETNGVTHIYLQQQVNGLVVQGAVININVTADGRILNVGSSFIGNAAQQANSNIPGLDANDAVTAAANYLSSPLTAPLTVVRQNGGPSQTIEFSTGGISLNNIPARLVYQPVSPNEVRLAWDIVIYPLDAQNWWNLRVDANSGQVLAQDNWVDQEHWGETGTGTSDDAAAAPFQAPLNPDAYRVYAIPDESPSHSTPSTPADGRILVANPATSASPFGWHDTNGAAGAEYTTTQGNNVHADEKRKRQKREQK